MICDIPWLASSGSVDSKLFNTRPMANLYKGPQKVHRNNQGKCSNCLNLQYFANCFVVLMLYWSNLKYTCENLCEFYNYHGHVSIFKYFERVTFKIL